MRDSDVDLVLWTAGNTQPFDVEWPLGRVHQADASAAHRAIETVLADNPHAWIYFHDARFGPPDPARIRSLLSRSIDIWHAGLKLGLKGLPEDMDYVASPWTLNRDPEPELAAISWRLSLRACLLRTEVLKVLGQIDPAFETLDAAGLEMGYRYIWRGAVMIHDPSLLGDTSQTVAPAITRRDRYVFVTRCFKPIWGRYVLLRRLLAGSAPLAELRAFWRALRACRAERAPCESNSYLTRPLPLVDKRAKVSVVIPTLKRYPYLEETLKCLEGQTVAPFEIICVDQTPRHLRQPHVYGGRTGLPLKVIWKDQPGQCSARNAGIEAATGDWILFVDDDVIIGPDYIESLLAALQAYDADIAVGVWTQGTPDALYSADRHVRVSDRLATGNSLARSSVVRAVGGFDLHYDRNSRADADLGMRLYLSGTISVITPAAHQHSLGAPTGGLRTFGAFDGTRHIGLLQPWPAPTQVYFWLRFFSRRQLRECLILIFFASSVPRELRHYVSLVDRLSFGVRQAPLAPFRIWGAWRSIKAARRLVAVGPRISLTGRSAAGVPT